MKKTDNMKRIFFSYVLPDEKIHLVTLFLEHLRRCGFYVNTPFYIDEIDKKSIESCDAYICFLTQEKDLCYKHILEQMRYVQYYNKKNLFVIECEGLDIPQIYYSIEKDFSSVVFNRYNFNKAITELKNKDIKIPSSIKAGLYAMMSLLRGDDSDE